MLTNLTLENFKAFQKLDDLKIKPITILCGTNSCGKSSILQSILLLKQTLENNKPNQNLLLNGRLVNLGQLQDIVFGKKLHRTISLSFTGKAENQIELYRFFGELTRRKIDQVNFGQEDSHTFSLTLELGLDRNNLDSFGNARAVQIKHLLIRLSGGPNTKDATSEIAISLKHVDGKEYALTLNRDKTSVGQVDFVESRFENLFPKGFIHMTNIDGPLSNIMKIFDPFSALFKSIFNLYTYIGPLRGEPERHYIYGNEETEIGNKGENAAYLYFTEQGKKIGNHYFYQRANDSFEEIPNQTLHSALRKWFNLMNIPNFEAELNNKIIYLDMEASAYDETRVGIADVGFGVSQIFPIILEGLRMEKGATLMLEQPEIHLHPNLQMQMADYFISLALSGKSVLVETHSDHVINRLVRRIVEDETHNLQDLIGIYFIKPSENGSVYEEVKIDETKGIVNWPPDFFDQTANEQMKIMQAGLKKRKNQRIPANGNAS